MIRSTTKSPVHELFSHEKHVVYEIPKYQREYTWSKEQWEALFSDLMGEDAYDGHFMGTIIALDKTEAVLVQPVLEIVDGQQRITTLALLLLAVYSELNRLKPQLDEDQVSDLANLRRMFVIGTPKRPRIRLQQQNHNNDDFLLTLKEAGIEFDEPLVPDVKYAGNRKIRKAFRYFENAIRSRIGEDDSRAVEVLLDVLKRVKQAMLVTLEVESHADAFILFESLNNRGVPLSPIDLIKNAMLAEADKPGGIGIDKAYAAWESVLRNLGDDYADQERFFRQFYNAFKMQWELTIANMNVATRARLITIYESMIKSNFGAFTERMTIASQAYGRIIDTSGAMGSSELDIALRNLARVQGAPSYILILNLLVNQSALGIHDSDLAEIVNLVIRFFVRRNLTNTPPTYDLDRLFISIVESWGDQASAPPIENVRTALLAVSASDATFAEYLAGPIYDDNSLMARFILVSLAQQSMTYEHWTDLWIKDQPKSGSGKFIYRWTIEHIVPQGTDMPQTWIEALGGEEEAKSFLQSDVHRLGNLTITAYNSALGNKSFEEKRDRTDKNGNFVGYKNSLPLNEQLATATTWTRDDIEERTKSLVSLACSTFAL